MNRNSNLLGLSTGARGMQELLKLLTPAEPFHFVCNSGTWDVLKRRFPTKEPTDFDRLMGSSKLALDFHGVNIFIDESVADGQVEKRPGRIPAKKHVEEVKDTPS